MGIFKQRISEGTWNQSFQNVPKTKINQNPGENGSWIFGTVSKR